MDNVAEGAHRGITIQMEHTPWEDPLTEEAALISELGIFYIICAAILLMVTVFFR